MDLDNCVLGRARVARAGSREYSEPPQRSTSNGPWGIADNCPAVLEWQRRWSISSGITAPPSENWGGKAFNSPWVRNCDLQ